jgi:hypothetical protein
MMKVIQGGFEKSFKQVVDAWMDGNKAKLAEIQHREDMAKARRSMFRVISCKCRV